MTQRSEINSESSVDRRFECNVGRFGRGSGLDSLSVSRAAPNIQKERHMRVKTQAKTNLGAKIAQTIRWRLIKLTDMQEPEASNNW